MEIFPSFGAKAACCDGAAVAQSDPVEGLSKCSIYNRACAFEILPNLFSSFQPRLSRFRPVSGAIQPSSFCHCLDPGRLTVVWPLSRV